MNQGRIWCVVSPTVGLPLFLGSVAITSLVVHACVMTHTDWMSSYWEGGKKTVSMNVDPAAATKSNAAFTMTVAPQGATATAPASFVITVTPNEAATQTAAVATAAVATAAPVRTASSE